MPTDLERFDAFTKFTDSEGNVLSFGSAKFGTAGAAPTEDPQNPYADINLTVPTLYSIPLNADGGLSIPVYWDGDLSVSVYDEDGTEILAGLTMAQSAPIVISGTLVWRDDTTGEPLASGKIYFGEPFKDPLKSPKNVYSDSGFATSIGSYVELDEDGTLGADTHLSGEYSVTVRDSDGVQVGYTGKYFSISPSTYTISGTVVDADSLDPIDDATVTLTLAADDSLVGTTSTDENGDFFFYEILPDTYDVSAEKDGYEPSETEINLEDDFYVSISLTLAPSGGGGGDVWGALPEGLVAPSGNSLFDPIYTSGDVWLARIGQLLRSTDDAATWVAVTPDGLNSGTPHPGMQVLAYAGGTTIAALINGLAQGGYASKSTDLGATWSGLTRGLNSGSVSANFQSIVGNGSGLWVATAIAGWSSVSSDDGGVWTAAPRWLDTGYTSTSGHARLVYGNGVFFAWHNFGFASRSTNGETWTALPQGLNSGLASHTSMYFSYVGNNTWVMSGSSGYSAISTDNGVNWAALPQGLNSGDTQNAAALASNGSGVVVALFSSGRAARSTDYGANWTGLVQGLNSGGTSTNWRALDNDGDAVFVAAGDNGRASRSDDYGATWSGLIQGLNTGAVTATFRQLKTDRAGVWVVTTTNNRAARSPSP